MATSERLRNGESVPLESRKQRYMLKSGRNALAKKSDKVTEREKQNKLFFSRRQRTGVYSF
jgi:hypothetical protein